MVEWVFGPVRCSVFHAEEPMKGGGFLERMTAPGSTGRSPSMQMICLTCPLMGKLRYAAQSESTARGRVYRRIHGLAHEDLRRDSEGQVLPIGGCKTGGRHGLEYLPPQTGRLAACLPFDAQRNQVEEPVKQQDCFIHESAYIDQSCEIGSGTKIWHFSHVMSGAKIGRDCILGQNVFVASGVVIGCNVKIQNNVSIYTGTTIEDDVFLGPSCVLTNVSNPRSQICRHDLYEPTLLRRGTTVSANATIVCGTTLGSYCFIAAGAVVTKDVPNYALMAGVPARQSGWMSRHGIRLGTPDANGIMVCAESGFRYQLMEAGVLKCLDWDEGDPLPDSMRRGRRSYTEFRGQRE